MITYFGPSFDQIWSDIIVDLNEMGQHVDTGHWQAVKDVPHTRSIELRHVHFEVRIPATPGALASALKPNLPWAEDHFKERVSGYALNPGEQYKNWPWYQQGVEDHKKPGLFSHTYMERFWPRRAGWRRPGEMWKEAGPLGRHGIRYRYGDLTDLLDLLTEEPHTRQAYLPIWFPEDLAAAAEYHERVPCTLGYHFMLRGDELHCFYPMRSVDVFRYLRDDLYMAGRLTQWIIEQLAPRVGDDDHIDRDHPSPWASAQPGALNFAVSSLHCFEGDRSKLERELLAVEEHATH